MSVEYYNNCKALKKIYNVGLKKIENDTNLKKEIINKLNEIENFFINYEIEIEIDISYRIEETRYLIDLLETGY